MCKIAAVTGVTDSNREKVWEFMTRLGRLMSANNSDGLGYAAFDKSNNIFGERWLINHHAFKSDANTNPTTYNYFGDAIKRDEAQAIILHTRMATCEKGLKNTHPFIDTLTCSPNIALIHNGVIGNHGKLTKKFSTCDSEVILHEYDYQDVMKDPANLKSVFETLSGWFACAVLAKTNNGPVLDLFTDGTPVHSAFITELNVRIFSTSEYDIRAVARVMNLDAQLVSCLAENSFRRYDLNGKQLAGGIIEFEKPAPTVHDFTTWGESEILDYWQELFNKTGR